MLRRISGPTKAKIMEAMRKLNIEFSLPNIITVPMKLKTNKNLNPNCL
jgi:hypothetical protein